MDQSYYNETLKKICELRSDFEKSLESIYEKYANIQDEGEGYLTEDIDKFYNSDTENDDPGNKVIERIHRVHACSQDIPEDILISTPKDEKRYKETIRRVKMASCVDVDSSSEDHINVDCNHRVSNSVKVRRSKHKKSRKRSQIRHHPYAIPATVYPMLIPSHLHTPPIYTLLTMPPCHSYVL